MDTTHPAEPATAGDLIDADLERLENADPADAAIVAEDIAGRLAAAVDLDQAFDEGEESGD